jgi:hypothetical protein
MVSDKKMIQKEVENSKQLIDSISSTIIKKLKQK